MFHLAATVRLAGAAGAAAALSSLLLAIQYLSRHDDAR
jgi:hypothetical protein